MLPTKQYVKVGNGDYVEAEAEGMVDLKVKTGGVMRKFILSNVLLVPELKFNLFSVPKVVEAGKTVEFGKQGCKIIDKSSMKVIGSGRKAGNLYYVNCVDTVESASNNKKNRRNNLNGKQMKKALNFVTENSFEKEMMKRLDKMEKTMKTNALKEEKHQNQEDIDISKENKYEGKQSSQEDINKLSEMNNYRDIEIQEDYQPGTEVIEKEQENVLESIEVLPEIAKLTQEKKGNPMMGKDTKSVQKESAKKGKSFWKKLCSFKKLFTSVRSKHR